MFWEMGSRQHTRDQTAEDTCFRLKCVRYSTCKEIRDGDKAHQTSLTLHSALPFLLEHCLTNEGSFAPFTVLPSVFRTAEVARKLWAAQLRWQVECVISGKQRSIETFSDIDLGPAAECVHPKTFSSKGIPTNSRGFFASKSANDK